MDIISRLPGCAGQAADVISALHPGQNGRCTITVESSEVVPLERNLYRHPFTGLLWERQFEKVLLKYGWEKVPNWECFFVNREKGLFLSVYVDDKNLDPMWKIGVKDNGLGAPTSFLDHVYLGCSKRECETSKDAIQPETNSNDFGGYWI